MYQHIRLLCAAIVSDTLRCLDHRHVRRRVRCAGALALIAGIGIESSCSRRCEAGSDLKDKSAEEIFYQDYKEVYIQARASELDR